MSDIELVIKIPEEKYNYIKKQVAEGIDNPLKVYIANGTPLPKEHGRLIDVDEIEHYVLPSEKQDRKTWFVHSEEYRNAVPHFNHAMRLLRDNAPTIIEADTESEVQQ